MAGPQRVRHPVVVSLFWRVVAINAGGLVVAALVLALSPATVSPTLTVAEGAVLTVGTLALIAVNVVLLRRVFEPLQRLAAVMRRIDPLEQGRRVELERPVAEVADVYRSFNAMLDRLEEERRSSGRRALMAQEGERRRIARELHDEVGQTLTGVVLQLEGVHRAAPGELAEQVGLVQETAPAIADRLEASAAWPVIGPETQIASGEEEKTTDFATSSIGRGASCAANSALMLKMSRTCSAPISRR